MLQKIKIISKTHQYVQVYSYINMYREVKRKNSLFANCTSLYVESTKESTENYYN